MGNAAFLMWSSSSLKYKLPYFWGDPADKLIIQCEIKLEVSISLSLAIEYSELLA